VNETCRYLGTVLSEEGTECTKNVDVQMHKEANTEAK
jgi:hypothetical protein